MEVTVKPKDLSPAKKWEIFEKYMNGSKVADLALEYNMKFPTMDKFIGLTCKKMNIVRETNALVNAQNMKEIYKLDTAKVSFIHPETINEEFTKRLSPDDDPLLSEAENIYCVVYAQTGNNPKAMKASGLDAGVKTGEHIQTTVNHALMLRGIYLRNRPKIANAITLQQQQILKDLEITKDYVQSTLVQNIEELKEVVVDDPKSRGHLLKSIELLGKTIGAFQENIKVENIDPADGLRTLIEMTKNHESGNYEQSTQ